MKYYHYNFPQITTSTRFSGLLYVNIAFVCVLDIELVFYNYVKFEVKCLVRLIRNIQIG